MCDCSKCGKTDMTGEPMYLYRNLKGKATFTGFIQIENEFYWVGRKENTPMKHIDTDNIEDRKFFLKEMRRYDK